jgi:hypothetical protein
MTDSWHILQSDGEIHREQEEHQENPSEGPPEQLFVDWEDKIYIEFIKPVIDYVFNQCYYHKHDE